MAGVAGERAGSLRNLARSCAAALFVVGLLVTAIAGGIVGPSHSRAVALHVGGHLPPAPVASPNAPAPIPASSRGAAASTGATGGGLPNAASAGGTGSGGPSTPTASATGPPVATERSHGPAVGGASSAATGPAAPPSQRPTPRPAPPPRPPGLGPRLLPGLPPVVVLPGRSHPGPPPPSSGATRYPSGSTGYDISWPQCGRSYPPPPYTVAIVGVNDGQAFSTNPCLGSESSWAGSGINLYININSPSSDDATDQSGPAGQCARGENACLAYNYGYNAAANSVAMAADQGIGAPTWWLDVETAGSCTSQFPTNGTGYWSCATSLNARTIQGAIDALRHAGVTPGDYSTSEQWAVITGGYVPSGGSVPNWIAGADPSQTSSWCSGSHDFGGGRPWLLQLATSSPYDQDQAC